ncbi:hypothetical protein GGR57DRAFT_480213 [Xylariaceae sp. FL1272]|nr:hypothetical protein GGR57DRAFT_480213 [Xylariaceae sp. FL1272]
MEGRRPGAGGANTPGNRTSGIPKPPSRLPLSRSGIPTPTTVSRSQNTSSTPSSNAPKPSLSQPSAIGSIRNPRLRPAASREQLVTPSATLPRSFRPNQSSYSQQIASKDSGSRNRSSSRDRTERPIPSQHSNTNSPFKQPQAPKRRPSSQFSHATTQLSTTTIPEDGSVSQTHIASTPTDEIPEIPEYPPLVASAQQGLTFDSLPSLPYTSRPSLSERTIATLANSPAVKRRGSDFFVESGGVRRPQSKGSGGSRPGSSYQSDGSNGRTGRSLSRPSSSSGPLETNISNFRASTNTYKPPLPSVQGTPSKRVTAVGSVGTPAAKSTPLVNPRTSLRKMPSHASLASSIPLTPSPEKQLGISVSKNGSRTLAARPLKARGSVNGLFKKPSMPSLRDTQSQIPPPSARKASMASSPRTSSEGRDSRGLSSPSATSTAPTVLSVDEPAPSTSRKSSSALRDQIAKAKAAKRAAGRQASGPHTSAALRSPVIPTDNTLDFGLTDDPFGQKKFEDTNRKALQSRIITARSNGRLNIAAMGLKEIPDEVLKMYELESFGNSGGAWAESVDLARLVASDNELETISDIILPDIDPNAADTDEMDDRGRIFWGLESADLHNNSLISLPLGLRRLEQLTSLNLSGNKLTNNCLEIIAQCSGLRDLKLANNLLYGSLGDYFILENLESLDIHGNNVSALPSGLDRMKRLRIINLDENAFESLPFQSLSALPLSELTVRKNKLTGTLIDGRVGCLSQLQILDCSGNQLSYIFPSETTERLRLPSLHQLTVSMNRLKALPDMSNWDSILTINADDNSIAALPEGFVSRETLRHAGFSSNDIRIIPPEIARMDNLVMLRITGNPLRDRKFTSLATDELKDALSTRLEPLPGHEIGSVENFANGIDSVGMQAVSNIHPGIEPDGRMTPTKKTNGGEDESDSDDFATPPTSAPHSPVRSAARSRAQTLSSQTWPIKAGGILDRSNTQSSSLHPVVCSKLAAVESVREIRLQHNTFSQFPNSLSFFTDTLTSLCLAQNQLTGESWLTEQIDLTALKELNLQSNFITSLTPLTTNLCAPNLEKLDVSFNRIVKLPNLRETFPSLSVLLIANNRLEELDPDAVQGIKVVDASNNEITHLNPRLGLLGLERLDVMGNRFRVPRWNVLERGTEATLRWLRGRVPVVEMAEWRAKSGITGDDYGDEAD